MVTTNDTEGPRRLEELERLLGHRFRDRQLLETALQHSSFANENPGLQNNERLEFLGDSVIALAVGHLLFEANPTWREGDLTRALHQLVDRRSLSDLACRLELGSFLRLGRTERRSAGETKQSILADAMEAVLGSIYLDGGLESVTELARSVFAEALRENAPRVGPDPKTRLQELTMARFSQFPSYELLSDSEQEGDGARFSVRVLIQGEERGSGSGRTKQAATVVAAQEALAGLAEDAGSD